MHDASHLVDVDIYYACNESINKHQSQKVLNFVFALTKEPFSDLHQIL